MTKHQADAALVAQDEQSMRNYSAMYSYATRIPDDYFVIEAYDPYTGKSSTRTLRTEGKVDKLPSRWGSISQIEFADNKWFEIFTLEELNRSYEAEQKIKVNQAKIDAMNGTSNPY